MNTTPRIETKAIVVYACSGCSDAGELADRTARALARRGLAEMSCLAGIGGRAKPLLRTAQAAEHLLVIDGCPLNCARHTLALAGFTEIHHLGLHSLGFRKGSCSPDDTSVEKAVTAATEVMDQIKVDGPAQQTSYDDASYQISSHGAPSGLPSGRQPVALAEPLPKDATSET